MNLTTIKSQLADYAKDIKLNLSSVLSEDGAPGLTEKQIIGIALASAYTTKNDVVIENLAQEAHSLLNDNDRHAIKMAVTLMSMNNIYYRSIHLISNTEYSSMPAKLRMNGIANPGVDKVDFELYSLAVSAINGCGMCLDAHEKQLQRENINKEGIQSVLRIAAVINASAQALTMNEVHAEAI